MIAIRASAITSLAELRDALQNAIGLEHATIPPYLTAYDSLSGISAQIQL